MKRYIVTEEELVKLNRDCHSRWFAGCSYESNIKDFLKSKKPVEEIASGEVSFDLNPAWGGYVIGDTRIRHIDFKDYINKTISILLEEK